MIRFGGFPKAGQQRLFVLCIVSLSCLYFSEISWWFRLTCFLAVKHLPSVTWPEAIQWRQGLSDPLENLLNLIVTVEEPCRMGNVVRNIKAKLEALLTHFDWRLSQYFALISYHKSYCTSQWFTMHRMRGHSSAFSPEFFSRSFELSTLHRLTAHCPAYNFKTHSNVIFKLVTITGNKRRKMGAYVRELTGLKDNVRGWMNHIPHPFGFSKTSSNTA